MENEERMEQAGPSGDPKERKIVAGDIVRIADNITKSDNGLDIPDEWRLLLFTVERVYEDETLLLVNKDKECYTRLSPEKVDVIGGEE